MDKYSVLLKATSHPDVDLEVMATSAFDAIQKAKEIAIEQSPELAAQIVYFAKIDRIV